MKGWSVGPEHLLAAHRNCEPGSDHWRRRRSGWTSYDEHPPPLYLHTVVSFFWWHFFWNKVMMLRKHPGVISRQSMRWHSHVFWKVLEFLSDLAMWTYWNPISRKSPGGLPNVCFLPWNTMKYPEVKIVNMITAVITFSICVFSACFDSIIETVIDIFESDMLHVLMLPTLWNSQFEQEIRIIFSQESDIKVWLNFSYCQGRISGMEMVHLFIYISPLVTKHYKTIIPPKTNIDPKWWFPNLLFQGPPISGASREVFLQCSVCLTPQALVPYFWEQTSNSSFQFCFWCAGCGWWFLGMVDLEWTTYPYLMISRFFESQWLVNG